MGEHDCAMCVEEEHVGWTQGGRRDTVVYRLELTDGWQPDQGANDER